MNTGAHILLVLAGIAWLATLAMLTGLRSSDPAGNGLTAAHSAIGMVVQWLLIAVLVLVAGPTVPKAQKLAVLFVVVLAAAASWTGMGLLNDSFYRAKWPLILPAVAPSLVVALL